jgi:tetratricopeptide (TPR) repeat protein
VRYILEGSVQRGGNRMRVNVQLIEAETGSHLWAERFDKPVADLFDMQDEIVSRLAIRFGQELLFAEAQRAERAASPDSLDHYFIGLGYYNKGRATGFHDKARFHFDRALDLDAENVDALVSRAWLDLSVIAALPSDGRAERVRSVEADLRKALKLRPDGGEAHATLGMLHILGNRAGQGIAECERALAIDPNFAATHAWIGLGKHFAGRGDETEAHVLEALRVSPRDTYAGVWMWFAAEAKLGIGCDEEAVVWCNRSIELNPNAPKTHFWLAAALAGLGRIEEAREAARAGLELSPGFTIARMRSLAFSDHPVYLAGRERVYEGLRLAGVPEE